MASPDRHDRLDRAVHKGKSMKLSIRPEGSQALARLALAALVLVGALLVAFVVVHVAMALRVPRSLLAMLRGR